MLRQCIESILALSLREDEREIILLDDGSKHPPINELGSLAEHIMYVRQENGGLSSARNHAISIATGEYLQFIDSDDYFISHNYNQLIDFIREKKMDMLMFRFSMKTPTSAPATSRGTDNYSFPGLLRGQGVGSKAWRGDEYLCHNNMRAAACCYVFRRELLGELRFVEGILHEDAMFTPQLMLRCNTLYDVNLQCYYYRQHEGTIMSRRTKDHIYRRLECHLMAIKHHDDTRKSLSGTARQGMERCVNQMIMGYVYFIVILLRNYKEYRRLTNELRSMNLYPLPMRGYNWKYVLFAMLTRL